MSEHSAENDARQDVWDSLTDEERRGVEKVAADLDDPDFYTADDLRKLADAMDWLAEGPVREAMVEIGGDRPWAWLHKHPSNGPTVQVAFRQPPTTKEFREALTRVTPPAARPDDVFADGCVGIHQADRNPICADHLRPADDAPIPPEGRKP